MNDFQILSKLGEGAYSVVHKVRRNVDGNIYALKKVKLLNLSEKEKQNALNEVRILASVKSKYVISYKEAFFDENESCLGIVMEYADKGDLYQKITEYKKASVYFDESDIWRIFIQIAKGLKALHEMKILHRDLKSANVFLFGDGHAKLGDLNVSKVARRGLGYTQTGTPYYASPEVWKDQPYDSKSDIWSLGCVLYEMITLRPPFRAENMEGLYNKVIKGQYNKIPERFSAELHEIVKLLLQVQPESRPNCDQILKHPIIIKRLEIFKAVEDNEESALLQTIRIPKNLLFLTDKLPQPNYEKRPNRKSNNSFTDEKTELPDIKMNQKANVSKRKNDKKSDKDSSEHINIKKDSSDERNSTEKKNPYLPSHDLSKNIINTEDNNNLDLETQAGQKKRRRIDNNDRSLDNIINQNINSNIKILKSENFDNSNNSLIRDRSPYEDAASGRRKNRENNIMMLPNIKNQVNHEVKDEGKKKISDDGRYLGKILPSVNNEHIVNIYKISNNSPNGKNSYVQASNRYRSNNNDKYYLKSVDKNYENNNYKQKKNSNNYLDVSQNYGSPPNIKIVPNRKLSPINKKMIKI